MIMLVVLGLLVHVKFHPYADRVANACANISLVAMIMVGIINFGWATFLYSESSFEQGDAGMIGQHLITFETILVQFFPFGVVLFCLCYFFYENLAMSEK